MALLYQSKLNHHFISAPVFARPDGLSKRQATWMISGNAQGRDIAHNLLSSIGKTVDYGDDVGAANVVKLCGNFLIAVSYSFKKLILPYLYEICAT
jgi:3-hydroxyisobutyrate dehydrogenase-like beta-hydroxyacid dehydrogenase